MSQPIVRIASGEIRGHMDAGICAFKGVAYGQARRFEAPQPPAAWPGVRDALAWGPSAPQLRLPMTLLIGDVAPAQAEDCLVLNVWTPAVNDGAKRPVMVWLHGGGFSSLSASSPATDGTRLARRGDVVVVSLNHRLSAFGFMHLRELGGEAYADSGNVGMLDIVLALRWVRDNIAQLGGDPSNVTIFGESGGGAKVSVLMAMPAARGLFSRAIVQSGSHLHGWTPEQATANARTLLHALELGDNDVAKLRELPVKAILRALAKVSPLPGGRVAFSPVIDGVSLRRAPWQPDAPVESKHVPLLVGSTATETTLLLGASTPELFSLSEDGLRERLRYWLRGAEPEPIIAAFRATTPAASPSDLFFAITTALRVRRQLWEQADLKLRQGGAPVWVYELAWETPLEGGKWRSPHALDVSLVFDNAAASAMTRDSAAADGVAAQMADSWIAFARSGDPNHPGIPAWPQHSDDGGHVMLFDAPSRVQAHWRAQERAALAGLPIHQVNR